ncbi:Lipase [Macleaya cordata]|uniref:Lipase n=1 Tax=Macleaya cordata TaxID=56857 RepID=A0A200QJH4_MACCD|nr:Lipase [Macleaya cordata]
MRLALGAVRPCTIPTQTIRMPIRCAVAVPQQLKLGKRWTEYHGSKNWEGLLDPLDDKLRGEILRYGKFVEATYNSFEFDPSSPLYATCRYPKHSLLNRSGLPGTGYRLTKNLHATSGIQLPSWVDKLPSWVSNQSSWIGYVAVCQDEQEITRLGRRDVVLAYRGTATCLEWLENLRSTLTQIPNATSDLSPYLSGPMVESGFLSLYTSYTAKCRSLQEEVREEISRLLQSYGDEPLSITITGHSLGAALATLTAYDITKTFNHAPSISVISFGGPRVGNPSFRCEVEKRGIKILRIVNSNDIITKVPGFVINDDVENGGIHVAGPGAVSSWLQKTVVENAQWGYADVGRELRLCSNNSPIVNGPNSNVATCHELDTYLHLVNGFKTSTCPLRSTAKRVLKTTYRQERIRIR